MPDSEREYPLKPEQRRHDIVSVLLDKDDRLSKPLKGDKKHCFVVTLNEALKETGSQAAYKSISSVLKANDRAAIITRELEKNAEWKTTIQTYSGEGGEAGYVNGMLDQSLHDGILRALSDKINGYKTGRIVPMEETVKRIAFRYGFPKEVQENLLELRNEYEAHCREKAGHGAAKPEVTAHDEGGVTPTQGKSKEI